MYTDKVRCAESSADDFHRWLQGFLVFSSCYLGTRPVEHPGVIRYWYLVNELFMGNKGDQWRDYDVKFCRPPDGKPVIPLGFMDV